MSYGPLTEKTHWLKEIGIGSDPSDAVTAAEAARAEADADSAIYAALGTVFTKVGSPAAYPPLIIRVAEMLGSAYLYQYIHVQHTAEGGAEQPETPADRLERKAMELLEKIKSGRLYVVDNAEEWVPGFGPSDSVSSPASIEEQDEEMIFDPRAKPHQYKQPADAWNEPAYGGSDDED